MAGKAYKTRVGTTQYKPTLKWAEASAEKCEGWCLCCGRVVKGVEPDARAYECEKCHKPKVFGGEELVMMGLVS